ncbi:cysteine dioxygenase [Orrella sp. 11846]|uniref:cysteine dioxygenase family protein n=1 Tax=Orrella sp. 11846 TaxID=3409913 RepID=UPI003B5AF0FB
MEKNTARFEKFAKDFTAVVDAHENDEVQILEKGRSILQELVANDDWLPEEFAQPHPEYYQQYLLHEDPQDRFSVVSFVWGPGQSTPIHDHTVWALIGMMRGSERAENFELGEPGTPMKSLGVDILEPGVVESLRPVTGDTHKVSNVYDDRVSISIHIYGGNIGKIARHVFDAQTSTTKPFISGYTNRPDLPSGAQAVQ